MPSSCEDIRIRKFVFVANTQFLYSKFSMYSADLEYVIQIVMIDVLKCIFKGTGSVISSVKSRKS